MKMTPHEFKEYLQETQALTQEIPPSPGAQEALFQLIERKGKKFTEHPHFRSFFQGERAFYLGQYEQALKHYLEAKNIPQHQFFCFRTSACLQESLGAKEKAVSFAQKALKIYPEDPFSQKVLKGSETVESTTAHRIPLGEEELKVLASLFEPQQQPEGLFSRESVPQPTPSKAPHHHVPSGTAALEQRVISFELAQSQLISRYIETHQSRCSPADNALYILHGWANTREQADRLATGLITERSRRSSGGFFIRWNGKGVVINPGPQFLETFHQKGLHIKDIDYVIVTRDSPDAHADVKEIYDLNAQLNKASKELQVINYYINPKAFQELSHTLKPQYKQERNTLHRLEIFVDSPDVEKIDLGSGITLSYFSATPPMPYQTPEQHRHPHQTAPSCLGICLDLKSPQDSIKIGYVSGTGWSPLLSHHLSNCDILITGFGSLGSTDFNKITSLNDGLGYFGTFSLLEEVNPRLMVCCEFSGREGDIRIEAVGKMRQERTRKEETTVLPGDHTLLIDLKTGHVRCSLTGTLVPPAHVKVAKLADLFGSLSYLSPASCLA